MERSVKTGIFYAIIIIALFNLVPLCATTSKDSMMVSPEMIAAWQQFFDKTHWQKLTENKTPKINNCGVIYELGNPLDRFNEDCAIADMRNIKYIEPHYHPEVEIYYGLQGSGILVIGGVENSIKSGDIFIVPSNTAHFIAYADNLIIGVVNTPPFNPQTYVPVYQSDSTVNFCLEQFKRLTDHHAICT